MAGIDETAMSHINAAMDVRAELRKALDSPIALEVMARMPNEDFAVLKDFSNLVRTANSIRHHAASAEQRRKDAIAKS